MFDDQFSTSYCFDCQIGEFGVLGKWQFTSCLCWRAPGWQIALLGAGGSYTSSRWTKSFLCGAMRGLLWRDFGTDPRGNFRTQYSVVRMPLQSKDSNMSWASFVVHSFILSFIQSVLVCLKVSASADGVIKVWWLGSGDHSQSCFAGLQLVWRS